MIVQNFLQHTLFHDMVAFEIYTSTLATTMPSERMTVRHVLTRPDTLGFHVPSPRQSLGPLSISCVP